jgi:CsbD-like
MPGVAVFRGRRTTSPEGMEIHVPLKSRGSKAGLGAMRVSPRNGTSHRCPVKMRGHTGLSSSTEAAVNKTNGTRSLIGLVPRVLLQRRPLGHQFGLEYHHMNWDQVEGKWKQVKGSIKQKWGKLTDDDLDYIAGSRDKLAA